jgi:hypothetical protein
MLHVPSWFENLGAFANTVDFFSIFEFGKGLEVN